MQILFREYGWPEKKPIRAQYRLLQLSYHMDDYSSKGSRVISQRKTHRNQQIRMTQDSIQTGAEDTDKAQAHTHLFSNRCITYFHYITIRTHTRFVFIHHKDITELQIHIES